MDEFVVVAYILPTTRTHTKKSPLGDRKISTGAREGCLFFLIFFIFLPFFQRIQEKNKKNLRI